MKSKTPWIAVGRSGGVVLMTQVSAFDVSDAVSAVREVWAAEGVKYGVIQYVAKGRFGDNEIQYVTESEEDDD